MRPVAGRYRPDLRPGLLVEQAILESRLRERSAISPRRSPIRPTWCSRAPKTPVYTARRSTVIDKYRKGEATATQYPDANKGKISDVGQ